jgi:hypothetical protein
MVVPSIVDPFFRQMYQKLAEEIEARSNTLVSGGAFIHGNIGVDAIATAMNYQKAVSYIEALQAVIELGIELDHERYGSKRKTEDGDE